MPHCLVSQFVSSCPQLCVTNNEKSSTEFMTHWHQHFRKLEVDTIVFYTVESFNSFDTFEYIIFFIIWHVKEAEHCITYSSCVYLLILLNR